MSMIITEKCTLTSTSSRKLKGTWSIELTQDIGALHGYAMDDLIVDTIGTDIFGDHLYGLHKQLNKLKKELPKQKDLDALMSRRKIQKLEYQIKNHKRLFPQEHI